MIRTHGLTHISLAVRDPKRTLAFRDDLAYIHHHSFGEFALAAAPGVCKILRKHGMNAGHVVEIGCGSGILARELTLAGYGVTGLDASPAMIDLARETAPHATLHVASFDMTGIPPCDAIVVMGEVLNYGTFDRVRTFIARAAESLRTGGVLLFDVAERGAYPAHEETRLGGDDWSVITIKESDGTRLTRRVLSFRKLDGTVRRDEELHALELYDRAELVALLRRNAFRVEVRRSYGTRRLPKGHAVYVAVRR
jgi:SAM-dependent methyltransferase